jgi:recombinational DNA repair protein RecT
MSDQVPPDWFDNAPPPSADGGTPASGGGARKKRADAPKMTPEQQAAETESFFGWLTAPERAKELRVLLPEKIDIRVFVDAAKTVVTKKPDYLFPAWRASLMQAVLDAAGHGLMPDGREGAIVPRYDSDAGGTRLVFQAMVWGIIKLGRETGAIKSVRAKIVFQNEHFRTVEGEEDIIEHVSDVDLHEAAYNDLYGGKDGRTGNPVAKTEAFWGHVRAAYCFIIGIDGTVTKRWMSRARLLNLKNASRAQYGPWSSLWVDEMILKAVILYTTKWINLDLDTASARRFQGALMIDQEIDLGDAEDIERPEQRKPLAIAAPGPKLDNFADIFAPTREREMVPAGQPREDEEATVIAPSHPAHERAGTAEGGGDRNPSPPSGHTDETASEPPPDPPKPKTAHERVAEIRAYIMTPGTTSADVHRMTQHDDYVKLIAWFAAHKRAEMVELGRDVSEAVDDRIGYLLQIEREGTAG